MESGSQGPLLNEIPMNSGSKLCLKRDIGHGCTSGSGHFAPSTSLGDRQPDKIGAFPDVGRAISGGTVQKVHGLGAKTGGIGGMDRGPA